MAGRADGATAEVIAIGDELTSGQRVDTNSAWLSRALGDLGIPVRFHGTAGDDQADIVRAFRQAVDRVDVIVITGGLGPTEDDLTRQALAKLTGSPLEEDPRELKRLRRRFALRGRTMPESNRLQACFPRGSRPIYNPHGTAPGVALEVERPSEPPVRIFALPGVPAEMREMWAEVAEALQPLSGKRQIRHHQIRCFGLGESELEQRLPQLIRRGRRPSVGITVHRATITLRVTADGRNEEECRAAIDETTLIVREHLGDLVFGEGEQELEHVVADLLEAQSRTLATVECMTDGLLANWLAATGRPSVFAGGLVFGDPQSVHRWLDGCVSHAHDEGDPAERVCRMARQARQRTGADLVLATGPASPSTSDSHLVFQAVATADRVRCQSIQHGGHPEIAAARTAKFGLDLVRRLLLHDRAAERTGHEIDETIPHEGESKRR